MNITFKIYEHTNITQSSYTADKLKDYLQKQDYSPMTVSISSVFIDSIKAKYEKLEKYCGRLHPMKSDTPTDMCQFINLCGQLANAKHHDSIIFDIASLNDSEQTLWTESINKAIKKWLYGVFHTIYICK